MGEPIQGEPKAGHRVEVIHAAVLVYADGTEGLVSMYQQEGGGRLTRFTFVTSNPMGTELDLLKEMVESFNLPEGAHIEWREYHRADS